MHFRIDNCTVLSSTRFLQEENMLSNKEIAEKYKSPEDFEEDFM